MAAVNLSSKQICLKAQISLSVDSLVVRLWIFISNVGCSKPHGVVCFNFIHNKFCKPYIHDCF